MVRLVFAVTIALVVLILAVPAVLLAILGVAPGSARDWREKVLLRYQRVGRWARFAESPGGVFVWMFAWFKMRLDPMFRELPEILDSMPEMRCALDIGCGYGVVACALLEWRAGLTIYGIDPDAARIAVAGSVFADRGSAFVGSAPDFERPEMPGRADAVFILDVIHFIPDAGLAMTLKRIHDRLKEGGELVLRSIVPPDERGTIWCNLARLRRWILGGKAFHRPVERIRQLITEAGFEVRICRTCGGNRELWWFIGTTNGSESRGKG